MTNDIMYLSTEMTSLDDGFLQDVSNSSLNRLLDLTTVASVAKKNNGISIYSVVMPIIGFVIIFMNLLVVISSGLILKKGNSSF